jgi:hypothetical protein
MKTYGGNLDAARTPQGGFPVMVQGDGPGLRLLDPPPSQKLVNHSPDGFCWGYHGSGPAQLALALLLDVTGSGATALTYYQAFKREVVAGFGRSWELTQAEVEAWLEDRRVQG